MGNCSFLRLPELNLSTLLSSHHWRKKEKGLAVKDDLCLPANVYVGGEIIFASPKKRRILQNSL